MIIIFEGMDNCLKDTSITLLKSYLRAETHVIKCSSPPKGINDKSNYQKKHYADMFNLIELSEVNGSRNLILNRSHFGEYVYSQLYRGYKAEWVFELEKEFLGRQKAPLDIILVLLYDSDNERLKFREDGKSLSSEDDEMLYKERTLFLEAFDRTNFKNKVKFDLSEQPRTAEGLVDTTNLIDEIISRIN